MVVSTRYLDLMDGNVQRRYSQTGQDANLVVHRPNICSRSKKIGHPALNGALAFSLRAMLRTVLSNPFPVVAAVVLALVALPTKCT
eukprot:1473008-Amphidinium_carterae.1